MIRKSITTRANRTRRLPAVYHTVSSPTKDWPISLAICTSPLWKDVSCARRRCLEGHCSSATLNTANIWPAVSRIYGNRSQLGQLLALCHMVCHQTLLTMDCRWVSLIWLFQIQSIIEAFCSVPPSCDPVSTSQHSLTPWLVLWYFRSFGTS